jgi:class 3 adenylate cyclase
VPSLGVAVSVGIHAGEVEYDDRTMSGITVFTGVRITGVAQPGEGLVSQTVKDLVAGSGITFRDRGTHVLRGLPGEWRLFSPDVSGAIASTSRPMPRRQGEDLPCQSSAQQRAPADRALALLAPGR